MEKYYSLIQIQKIDFENPKSHIIECETLNEAKNIPGTDIIVIKKTLPSRNAVGSTFFYPHVFRYKIIDLEEAPLFLKLKNTKLTHFILETFRSGYFDDEGWGEVSILDINNVAQTINIKAGFNDSAIFVINILNFLFSFETLYNSNWKFYHLMLENLERIKHLEKENSELKENISNIRLKLKEAKTKKTSKNSNGQA